MELFQIEDKTDRRFLVPYRECHLPQYTLWLLSAALQTISGKSQLEDVPLLAAMFGQ